MCFIQDIFNQHEDISISLFEALMIESYFVISLKKHNDFSVTSFHLTITIPTIPTINFVIFAKTGRMIGSSVTIVFMEDIVDSVKKGMLEACTLEDSSSSSTVPL